jgi:hypothetical protein
MMIETAKNDPETFWREVGETVLHFGIKVLAALLIFGIGILTGATLTLLILLIAGGKDERADDIDLDMRIYVPHRDRDRGGSHGRNSRLATETEALKEHAKRLNIKIGD